jgi:hypothetical protein
MIRISGTRTDFGAVGATGWTDAQREHLVRCIERGDRITYWCSDAHGRPANGGSGDGSVWPGMGQEVDGPLHPCTEHALHATDEPHRWCGSRVWVVALVGQIVSDEQKCCALRREIIGEVLREHAWDESCGARLGRRDLAWANLAWANLADAHLADAHLADANLAGANLAGANLTWSNLAWAYLADAHLAWANLTGANLTRANFAGANLARANLTGVDLVLANLTGANLAGAYYPTGDLPVGWRRAENGYLERSTTP